MTIDWGFIGNLEGGQATTGYVPDSTGSMSGVTIATGVDLGQRSARDIRTLAIPEALKATLAPYAGLTGQGAVDYLAQHPLAITRADANSLDQAAEASLVSALRPNYDGDAGAGAFDGLPDQAQTAIVSVATQYGSNLRGRTPNFWREVTSNDWAAAVAELRNFHDNYPARHNREADLLQQIVVTAETVRAEEAGGIPPGRIVVYGPYELRIEGMTVESLAKLIPMLALDRARRPSPRRPDLSGT